MGRNLVDLETLLIFIILISTLAVIAKHIIMNEKVSIEIAIFKGHKMVTFPVMIIILSVIGIGLYLEKQGLEIWWLSLPIAIVSSWLYWSFVITKWRIWAFEHVENIEELKRQAVDEKLIWKDGSIFEKTEIKSARQREILSRFEK